MCLHGLLSGVNSFMRQTKLQLSVCAGIGLHRARKLAYNANWFCLSNIRAWNQRLPTHVHLRTSRFHGLCVFNFLLWNRTLRSMSKDLSLIERGALARSHRIWVQLKLLVCSGIVIVYTNLLLLTAVPDNMYWKGYTQYPNSKNKLPYNF